MADLKTNFKNDILAESMNGRRRYQMIQNSDGTVSFDDATEYTQVGDNFGAGQVNATNEAVNGKLDGSSTVDPMLATEPGFAADAKLTKEAINNCFQSVSNGKALLASAITDKGITTDASASFIVMAENIKKIAVSPKSLKGQDRYWQAMEVVTRTVNFTSAFSSTPKVNASAFIVDTGGTSKNLGITITSISRSGFNYKTAMPSNYGDVTVTWNAVV